jgi:O-antigen ligase
MYGALLGMIFFLPYSLALIEACQLSMIVAWTLKRFLLYKMPARQDHCPSGFNLAPGSMAWPLIAIALLIVLTIPFSHCPALSTKKFFSRFLQQIFLMYVVTQIIHNRRRLYSVLSVLLLTLFFVIIDVMAQFIRGKSILYHTSLVLGRVTGPMKYSNDLGTLLATVLPVVLILMITYRRWVPLLGSCYKSAGRGISGGGLTLISILFFLLLIALGLTSSRGAWIAFAVGMITIGSCLKSYKVMALIFFVLVIFFWIFSMHCLSTRIDMYDVPMTQGPRLSPSFTNPLGLPPGYNALEILLGPSGRGSYWKTAINVIKHYPWFGCGYSAYVQTLRDLNAGHEEYPHNSLLQITVELGFLGLILYGWFFVTLCRQIKSTLRAVSLDRDLFLLGCGISSGILAWSIHSLLDTAWASLQLGVLWWLFIGILLSLGVISTNHKAPPVVSG